MEFSSSLIEQSKAINADLGDYDVSLVCFVNKQPTKIEKTTMFSGLLDENTSYDIEKNKFVGHFGGLFLCISFFDEKAYGELIKKDPYTFETIITLYDSKIIFDKTGEMTKNYKLVNKGGRKLKKSEIYGAYYGVSRRIALLEKSYKEEDVIYFFNLCEQIKESFTTLLFLMNGKPFFSFRGLKTQMDTFEVMPEDFYSNLLLATQIDDVQKKIALFKRILYNFGILLGIGEEQKDKMPEEKSKKIVDTEMRGIVENKIKQFSVGGRRVMLDTSEDEEAPESDDDDDDEKSHEEE
jgi:hypothetical protein